MVLSTEFFGPLTYRMKWARLMSIKRLNKSPFIRDEDFVNKKFSSNSCHIITLIKIKRTMKEF